RSPHNAGSGVDRPETTHRRTPSGSKVYATPSAVPRIGLIIPGPFVEYEKVLVDLPPDQDILERDLGRTPLWVGDRSLHEPERVLVVHQGRPSLVGVLRLYQSDAKQPVLLLHVSDRNVAVEFDFRGHQEPGRRVALVQIRRRFQILVVVNQEI